MRKLEQEIVREPIGIQGKSANRFYFPIRIDVTFHRNTEHQIAEA